jgi:hypothetical protein
VAAEGGEGEAADVTVSRLLERRRLLHGLVSRDSGSDPLLLLHGLPPFSDQRQMRWIKE